MDADHLDIYGDKESIEESFREFAEKVEDKSKLFITKDLPLKGVTCAINEEANFTAFNIKIINSQYIFDVKTPTETLENVAFGLPGKHNLMNALMALAMAKTYGLTTENIVSALRSFNGIKRRVYIDDYAHHPTEINAVHQAVRELYPTQKVLAIFQPHLFSRTKDFADDFAKSLAAFDEIILLEIYPARELPMEGITSSWLLDKIDNSSKKLVSKQELIQTILDTDATVIVTIGAGDIGEMVTTIKTALNETL
jgi:UDP-N-acetylmuramate--alanine ligase